MKPIILAILAFAAFPTAALAAPRGSNEAASNNAIATAFYDLAFVKHQPAAAAGAYLGEHYIQHNPRVPNGPKAFIAFFENFLRTNPGFSTRVYRVVAEDDLVVIHAHAKKDPQDPGLAIVDIFRVEHGKIVEHWDVIQPVTTGAPNGNTMFDGNNAK